MSAANLHKNDDSSESESSELESESSSESSESSSESSESSSESSEVNEGKDVNEGKTQVKASEVKASDINEEVLFQADIEYVKYFQNPQRAQTYVPPIINKETIMTHVKPITPMTKEDFNRELSATLSMINTIESNMAADNINTLVRCVFGHISILLKSEHAKDNASIYLLVKALFHRYIATYGHHDIICYYNEIYSDNQYADIADTDVFYPTLTEEWKTEMIRQYQDQQTQIEYRRNLRRKPPQFELNEIVGAKDKEGRWWLSKVLAIYSCGKHSVYYVEFAGWGDQFNEFIVDRYRIEKFKPKKHKYFQPAWKK
jgi:hypothetical protein